VLIPGAQSLLVVRVLRLLRIFRVLKLAHLLGQAEILLTALRASRPKITVFLGTVLTIVVVTGALMYVVEGGNNGFDSIPRSMYWAIVTVTTVAFGDITPKTVLGQLIASVLMVMGYGIIAAPRATPSTREPVSAAASRDMTWTRRTASTAGTACNPHHGSSASSRNHSGRPGCPMR
jgi:voltage-gated potassium channel Kch